MRHTTSLQHPASKKVDSSIYQVAERKRMMNFFGTILVVITIIFPFAPIPKDGSHGEGMLSLKNWFYGGAHGRGGAMVPSLVVAAVAASTPSESQQQQRQRFHNQNYHPYQYDLTIPQFTPDGRLLQVEYAHRASTDHSIPIVAAYMIMNNPRMNPNVVHEERSSSLEAITVIVSSRRTTMGQQSRLIVLPSFSSIISSNSNHPQQQHHSHNNCIVIAISGILADALSILQTIQAYRIQEYRTMGIASSSSSTDTSHDSIQWTRRIATQIASQCQSRTLSGGKRPLGATLWITAAAAAVHTNHDNNHPLPHSFVIHQTDPSGALHDIILKNDPYHSVAVLGGGTVGTKLHRRLQQEWAANSNETYTTEQPHTEQSHVDSNDAILLGAAPIRKRIGQLLSIILEEFQNNYFPEVDAENKNDNPLRHGEVDTTTITTSTSTSTTTTSQPCNLDEAMNRLEVVVLSSTRGTIQLTPHQIRTMVREP
jgi:Proteasome subunit A N-terminal signature